MYILIIIITAIIILDLRSLPSPHELHGTRKMFHVVGMQGGPDNSPKTPL